MSILDRLENLGFVPALVIVIALAMGLQLSGVWITMLVAGVFGGFFTRTYLKAFLAGFLGVGIAWSIMFIYLIVTTPAMAIAVFFIGLLGLAENLGTAVITIAILIGAFLGGFGGVLGRAVFELVEDLAAKRPPSGKVADTEPHGLSSSRSQCTREAP